VKGNKTSYKDIVIYTVAILSIIFLQGSKIISYNTMVVLLVIALATFAIYNLRHQLNKWFNKKKN
jgi:hypothetical protein